MGRYYYSHKEEADGLHQVNTAFLRKHGYFNSGWRSGTINWSRNGEKTGSISIQSFIGDPDPHIKLIYTQTNRFTDEKTDCNYKIPLTTTPCNFGGKRFWFICPWYVNSRYCGRRVGVLYLSDKYFACRHCYNLTYSSRNLSGFAKAAGQVISEPYLEELRAGVKREYYAGKMTRKYKQFLKKEDKAFQQLRIIAGFLYKRG
jgi:hypothetical protein